MKRSTRSTPAPPRCSSTSTRSSSRSWRGCSCTRAFRGGCWPVAPSPSRAQSSSASPPRDAGRSAGVGAALCVVAAFASAAGLVLQKPLLRRMSALEATWLACTVGTVACLPFAPQLVAPGRRGPHVQARLDRLPRHLPDRGRLHDLVVRARAHRSRPTRLDDLSGRPDRDRPRLAVARGDSTSARTCRRGALRRRRRARSSALSR